MTEYAPFDASDGCKFCKRPECPGCVICTTCEGAPYCAESGTMCPTCDGAVMISPMLPNGRRIDEP